MKLIQTIKNHLPVSRKAHMKAIHQAEMDQAWLLAQLKQSHQANLRLKDAQAKAKAQGV